MASLHIERLERYSSIEFALRFTGPRDDFMALVGDLKAEGREYARWEPSAFGEGCGAWVVDEGTLLMFYKERFDNLERRMQQAQARAAVRAREN